MSTQKDYTNYVGIEEEKKLGCDFSQPRLIQNILEAKGMADCNGKPTPTENDLHLGPQIGSKLEK
eukprot:6350272-Ditylum_brightwellii.AAC.1